MGAHLDSQLADHVDVMTTTIERSAAVIDAVTGRLVECFVAGGKVLACGNGGSAADAQHFVAEFMNRMRVDRRPWPAIALSTDTSVLTSIANDADFVYAFARQVEALGRPGDVLIAFTTSGRSANVLAAIDAAKRGSLTVVVFTGQEGGRRLGPVADIVLAVASNDTPRVQECHEFVYHYVAEAVEAELERVSGNTA